MKIVIDTNVVYSALYSDRGASHALLAWLFNYNDFVNVVSTPLVKEFEDVLTRKESLSHFGKITIDDVDDFINDICAISHKQIINFLWRPFLCDMKDDMILEAAFNAGADYIVTHNIADFKDVEKYFQIKIIKPVDFLRVLRNRG